MAAVVTDIGRVLERELRIYLKLWRSSLFSSIVSPLLFLVGLGLGLGGVIDERRGAVEGLTYLQFVTPGLLAASAMQTATMMSLWPIMAGTTWTRWFHGIVATPISAVGVYGGWVAFIAVRATQFGVVFLAFAAAFGGVPSWWGVLAVPAVVLTALAFAAPVTAYSGTQLMDLSFPLIFRLGVMPLFLFSETFFPLEQLPSWLRPAAWLSPLWHGVELCRAATTGSVESWPRLAAHLLLLLAVIAAGAAWGRRTFTKRLTG